MGDGFPGSESITQLVSQAKELDISDVSLFKEWSFSVKWENSEFRRELAPIVAEILYIFSKLPQKFEIYFQVFCLVKSCWFESVLHHWIESGPGTNVTPDRLFTQFTILQNCINLSFLHFIFFKFYDNFTAKMTPDRHFIFLHIKVNQIDFTHSFQLFLNINKLKTNKLASSVDAIAICKIWNILTHQLTHSLTGVGAIALKKKKIYISF